MNQDETLRAIERVAWRALEGDSNDDEHDALVRIADLARDAQDQS